MYISNAAIKSTNAQGGVWSNNEVDNGRQGIIGNIINSIIVNNRFFGITEQAIYVENGKGFANCNVTDNHFEQCENCFTLVDSNFAPTNAEPEECKIMHSTISNNIIHICESFVKLTGGRSIFITGNHTSRMRGSTVDISSSKKMTVTNNHFTGVGENTIGAISQYVTIKNNSLHIVVKMNQFDGLNLLGEQLDFIIKKDSSVDSTKLYLSENEVFDYPISKYKNF